MHAGPQFWDQDFLAFTRLERYPIVLEYVPRLGLNDAAMVFGGLVLAFNIVTRYAMINLPHTFAQLMSISSYINVLRAKLSNKEAPLHPLLHLLPFPVTVGLQLFWLSAPTYTESRIINSGLLVPFLLAWGLQAAHLVSRIILAHVTKQSFPLFDSLFLWSVIGAVDANMPLLLGR